MIIHLNVTILYCLVQVWFQNYRQKIQKQQLLASIKANKLETCNEQQHREAATEFHGAEAAGVLHTQSRHSSRQSSDSMLETGCNSWLNTDDQNAGDERPTLSRSRSSESLSSGGAFGDSHSQEEQRQSEMVPHSHSGCSTTGSGPGLGLVGGCGPLPLLLSDQQYSGAGSSAAVAAAMRRQRTSISAEQFEYLSAQYARLTHPTQEQLEHMSRRTGLHRRVVQVCTSFTVFRF